MEINTVTSGHFWSKEYDFYLGENKIVNLEEELKVVGENLKALEVAEEKAQLREEEYKKQIRNFTERLKTAESRFLIFQPLIFKSNFSFWLITIV